MKSRAQLTIVERAMPRLPSRQQNEAMERDAHLHLNRLGLFSLGWGVSIGDAKKFADGTGVSFIKPSRDRALAIVPLRICDRLLGNDWQKHDHHWMNFAAFAGMSNVEFILDRIEMIGLTYLGTHVGAIIYADRLLEKLKQLD